jgi:hypothetical protein
MLFFPNCVSIVNVFHGQLPVLAHEFTVQSIF